MSSIEIPAAALRAAVLMASKDDTRRVLCGVYIAWEDGQEDVWEIAATDSFRLFHAKDKTPKEGARRVILDAEALKTGLKATDVKVRIEESDDAKSRLVELKIYDKKGAIRGLILQSIDGNYPDFWHLLPEAGVSCDLGSPAAINAKYLESFCKATAILKTDNLGVVPAIRFATAPESKTQTKAPEMRPVLVTWPNFAGSYTVEGLLMPVRL